jgi:hypothetical protein
MMRKRIPFIPPTIVLTQISIWSMGFHPKELIPPLNLIIQSILPMISIAHSTLVKK